MARKSQPDPPGKPQVPADVGIRLLQKQIDKANALLAARPLSSDDNGQWQLLTRNYLEKAFGTGSPNVSNVTDVTSHFAYPMDADEAWWEDSRAEDLSTQVTRLEGLVELLETEIQLGRDESVTPPSAVGTGYKGGRLSRSSKSTATLRSRLSCSPPTIGEAWPRMHLNGRHLERDRMSCWSSAISWADSGAIGCARCTRWVSISRQTTPVSRTSSSTQEEAGGLRLQRN
jgi:hypothetical protein